MHRMARVAKAIVCRRQQKHSISTNDGRPLP